jgi:hypothetical protein
MAEDENKTDCPYCHGSTALTQWGIFRIYLWPCKLAVLVSLAGVLAGFLYSWYFWLLGGLFFLLPLSNADLRLYLYPVVSLACLCGKRANCPKCLPDSSVFSQ